MNEHTSRAGRHPRGAELSEHVRLCIGYARGAVLDVLKPKHHAAVSAFASTLKSTLDEDPFETPEDIALWTADQLDRVVTDRDTWREPEPSDDIQARMTFAVELAKWLFPSFGRLPTYRDEIARLRVWPRPYVGRGEA